MKLFYIFTTIVFISMGPMIPFWLTVSITKRFEIFEQIWSDNIYQIKYLFRPCKGWRPC
jgi:hypothetical protein